MLNKNLIIDFNTNSILYYTAFYGYSKHSLVFEKEYDSWAIINITANEVNFTLDHNNYKVLAVLSELAYENNLPTGLNKWRVFDSDCDSEEVDLKFTVVSMYFLCMCYQCIISK